MTYMYGPDIHDACQQFAREMGSVGAPDPGFDREFDRLQAAQIKPRPGPRYGVRATADIANQLNSASAKYRETDLELEAAVRAVIRLAYDQSNWIEKVFTGLARAAQEAER